METKQLERQQAGELSLDKLRDRIKTSFDSGLSASAIDKRLEQVGKNALREKESRGAVDIFIEQFKDVIIWLLAGAGIAAFLIGETVEGSAVFAVILVNALIGFITEWRAVRSMEALRELGKVETAVRRDGDVITIPADELVPGDVVILDSGDVVPADLRLIEANQLQADEAALTGESEQVTKSVEALSDEVELAEQTNMVFKGTAITRGSGEGVVTATGMDTELGHISEMVDEAEEEATPLEERLASLGQTLVWVTLAIAAVVTGSGVIVGRDPMLMVETGIALAIASVPEGLPITATIALARGMQRMADRNALVTKLSTVETLGSTNIICTDKTGTLTAGRMSVQYYQLSDENIRVDGDVLSPEGTYHQGDEDNAIDPQAHEILEDAIKVGVLCSNASVTYSDGEDNEPDAVGEPLEVALLVAGLKAGYSRDDLLEKYPEEREIAFDPDTKMMATIHNASESDEPYFVAVKGAPEAVLDACTQVQSADGTHDLTDDDRQQWRERNKKAAKDGLRMLALAYKTTQSADDDPYANLTLLAMTALLDPPREEVKETIEACQDAGIRLVMVTGDQELTARKVADVLGIANQGSDSVVHGSEIQDDLSESDRQKIMNSNILTRVSPEQKLKLISVLQETGNVIAMTGDGVNDAPALKKSDIGVAMGSGTQVAKDAADVILQDDNLQTIILAIRQGRTIFNNIRRFMVYLFSSNVSTILTVGIASVINAPLPLLPLQILFLNVVVDVFPALALGIGDSPDDVMKQPPKDPDTSILEREHWTKISVYGALIAASVLGAFFLAQSTFGLAVEAAVTISFLTLMLAKLWHVFNMRDANEHIFVNSVTRNLYVWGAFGLSIVLILAAVYVPLLANILSIVPPMLPSWGLAIGMSLIPLVVIQMLKVVNLID